MRSNYKKIGEYIRQVNNRNKDLKVSNLLGINIDKFFMPSVANIVGTDLSVYKKVSKGQFACNRMHVGRDMRLPVALSKKDEDFIVSPAYDVFEIIDEKELLPEYLMMWFSRKEFDRNAWFYTDADVRQGLSWDAFINIELPVPDITKQQEIVDEYNAIKNRISLNNSLIEKLEETAKSIYKEWFVDFEFPDENGKPYKSSGGEMEFCSELEKEVPKGWKYEKINDFSKDIITGKTPFTEDETNFNGNIPFLTIPDMHNRTFVFSTERYLSNKGALKNKILPENSICVSCIGTAGLVVLNVLPSQTNQQINSIIPKKDFYLYYLFLTIKSLEDKIKQWGGKGSVGVNMNKSEFSELEILFPNEKELKVFDEIIKGVFNVKKSYEKENENLGKMKDLILSKMASES